MTEEYVIKLKIYATVFEIKRNEKLGISVISSRT